MTRSPRTGPPEWLPVLVSVATTGAVLVLVWAATTGPVRMFGAPSGSSPARRGPAASPTSSPSETPDPLSAEEITKNMHATWDGSWLGKLLAYTLLIVVVLALLAGVRWLWRNRWHAPPRPAAVAFEVLPEAALAEALHRDVDAQLSAVEQGGPRDAIVACWLRLQDVVTECGHPPRPTETSAEFVTRLLHALDVDPRSVDTLARLYREARFSEHEMGEDSRTAARTALHALSEDLRSRAGVP
jgi:hypothetical protein